MKLEYTNIHPLLSINPYLSKSYNLDSNQFMELILPFSYILGDIITIDKVDYNIVTVNSEMRSLTLKKKE